MDDLDVDAMPFSDAESEADVVETPAQKPVTESKEELKGEIAAHKEQLERLKQQDPEFFEFLAKNDQGLLNFSDDSDDDSESGDDDAEMEDEEDQIDQDLDLNAEDDEMEAENEAGGTVLTLATVQKWQSVLSEQKSLRTLRRALVAFRVVVHMNDDDKEDNPDAADEPFIVKEEAVMNEVIALAVRTIPAVFHSHLKFTDAEQVKKLPSAASNWGKFRAMAKSYVSSMQHLFEQVTDATMVEFIIHELTRSGGLVYFACFPKSSIGKTFLKTLMQYWTMTAVADEETQHDKMTETERLRIVCFLAIRKLALCGEQALTMQAFKQSYVAFLGVAKSSSAYSAALIYFLGNCLVELFTVDASLAYQHAFVSIRQIAIHLRAALTQHNDANHRQVYQWSVVHALKLWCRVISNVVVNDAESSLRALIFPLVQVALGVVRLLPSPQYHPLRLHVMRALIDLSRRTETFVPLSPHLLDLFSDMVQMATKTKPSTLKPLDFSSILRAPKPHMNTRVYLDGLLDETVELSVDYFSFMSDWVAYPESIVIFTVHAKKLQKSTKYGKLAKSIGGLLEKLERNRQQVMKARQQIAGVGPLNVDKTLRCDTLNVHETVLGRYSTELKRAKEQQRRLLTKSRK